MWRSRGIVSQVIILGIGWRWVVSFMLQLLHAVAALILDKQPSVLIGQGLGGPQS